MPESVVLTGPVSPADVAHLLDGADAEWAAGVVGYRGIPTSELACALVAAGVRVEAVTTACEVDAPKILEGPRFRLLVAPMRPRARHRALDLFLHERRHLASLLRQTDAEVVHAMWTYEYAWAAQTARRRVLVTAHDAPLTILGHTRDAYRLARTAMAYAVRARLRNLVVVSPYLLTRWRREMLYRGPGRVIPNIAPTIAPAAQRARHDAPLIVDVTDAGSLKNVPGLIRGFRALRERGLDATLALAGHGLGPDGDLATAVRARGEDGDISWLGPLERDELARLYRSASLFVHSSREESFGLSVVEAMSCGLPVVGGRTAGAVPWLLDGGGAGVLVDVDEPLGLADAMARLLEDVDAAAQLGERARARSLDFGATPIVAAYLDEYERVLRSPKR